MTIIFWSKRHVRHASNSMVKAVRIVTHPDAMNALRAIFSTKLNVEIAHKCMVNIAQNVTQQNA